MLATAFQLLALEQVNSNLTDSPSERTYECHNRSQYLCLLDEMRVHILATGVSSFRISQTCRKQCRKDKTIRPHYMRKKWPRNLQKSETVDGQQRKGSGEGAYPSPVIAVNGCHYQYLFGESINQKITTYKSDQWCTTHLKTKIKPKDNVQKIKTTQR